MALYYGNDGDTSAEDAIEKLKIRKTLAYSWIYPANSNGTKKRSAEYKTGHPTPYAATYGLDKDSTLTFLTHKYDTDKVIDAPFSMEYKVWCLHKTGVAANVSVWTADLAVKHRVGKTNIFALNHTVKFSDIISWYADMVGSQVEIKLASSVGYPNESVLDVQVTI